MAQALLLEEFSTITAKGQTTVPKSVRQALGVDAGDQIAFRLEGSNVSIRRVVVDQSHSDPAIGAFLSFMAKDMHHNLTDLSPDLMASIGELVDGIDVSVDSAIEGDVAI